MPLRDNDLPASLSMATSIATGGEYRLGHETLILLGDEDASWAMVARHEQAHLELNLATTFGVVLRVMAQAEMAGFASSAPTVESLLGLCHETHELVATATGVWWTCKDYECALDAYPGYIGFLKAASALVSGFPPGSYAAWTALMCAGLTCMQAPLGPHLGDGPVSIAALPESVHPDRRLEALMNAGPILDADTVELPERWLLAPLVGNDTTVPGHEELWERVAGAYYEEFATVLREAGMPCQPYDEVDPAVVAWAGQYAGGSHASIPVWRPRDGAGPRDPFWPITVGDLERVRLHTGRPLLITEIPRVAEFDAPELVADFLVAGAKDATNTLVIARPLRALLRQYDLDEDARQTLENAAVGGVVTAVRRDGTLEGEPVSSLALLRSPGDLRTLRRLPSDLGTLASVSMACFGATEWFGRWLPALEAETYLTVLIDLPRRPLIDTLEQPDREVLYYMLEVGRQGRPSLFAQILHLPWLGAAPFFAIGSELMARGLEVVFDHAEGLAASRLTALAADPDRCAASLMRLIGEEPEFDALAALDLDISAAVCPSG